MRSYELKDRTVGIVLDKVFPRAERIENIDDYVNIIANEEEALSLSAMLQTKYAGVWSQDDYGVFIVFPELKIVIRIQEGDEE